MDYDSKPLTSAEAALDQITTLDAARICRDILHIPVASIMDQKPLQLVPLGSTPKRRRKPKFDLARLCEEDAEKKKLTSQEAAYRPRCSACGNQSTKKKHVNCVGNHH